ncbi:hypothetical protein [Faecalibacter bovis]|uniref:Uncharacterized protein n=1 Tax=Faecalibacter bovis TaxID=2898187 RepID=A0ABX7XA97_9FLAO|nr:hypothetical protein [Faecalibacter bovis]MBS7332226.1 hypothetical protein [Weeksellaceae bacterium]QTV04821.1 hypothetical protein J9309_08415 [Faecalibacter bovis]
MQTNKPYLVPYSIVLTFISIFSVVIFFQHKLTVEEDIHPAIITYFLIKAFLIFANWVQPFKYFNFNPILFKALINLGIAILLAFLYLKLYQVDSLIFIDCGLCLITVFSLMKMQQRKNAAQNYF